VERGYQPRLIALSIVPNYLVKEPWNETRFDFLTNGARKLNPVSFPQLNTLQTVVPLSTHIAIERREYGQASRLISTS
jgi:hypothetical protein